MSTVPPVCETLHDASILSLIIMRVAHDPSGYLRDSISDHNRYIKWENKTFNHMIAVIWEHILSQENQIQIITEFVAYKLG